METFCSDWPYLIMNHLSFLFPTNFFSAYFAAIFVTRPVHRALILIFGFDVFRILTLLTQFSKQVMSSLSFTKKSLSSF